MAQKGTFCAHLLDDNWKTPGCVQVCPAGALRAVCMEEGEMRKTREMKGLRAYEKGAGKDSVKLRESVADNHGDFKFYSLGEKSGEYIVTIKADDFGEKRVQIDPAGRIYPGDIYL